MLGAWLASPGRTTEEAILDAAKCTPAVAFRVWVLRRAATVRLVALWQEGALKLRQVERIALACPFDEEAQLDEASAASPLARVRVVGYRAKPSSGGNNREG